MLDFGIAKIQSEPSSVDALETQAGTVFGTPRYMSPEQAQGRRLDARSDLYSLGVLLYQMLVGRAPFTDEDAVVVMARHIKSVPVSPEIAAPDAGIGTALARVVMRTLAKDPAARPDSARHLIAELDEALASRAAGPRAPAISAVNATGETAVVSEDLGDRPPQVSARRSRRGGLVAGATALAAASAFVAIGTFGSGSRVPLARAELAHLVALRLQTARAEALAGAAITAGATSSASPKAPPVASTERPAPSASAPPVRSPGAPLKKGTAPHRGYTRFD